MATTQDATPTALAHLEEALYARLTKRLEQELASRLEKETRRQRGAMEKEWKKLMEDGLRQIVRSAAGSAFRGNGSLAPLIGGGDALSGFLSSQGQLLAGLAQLLERAARDR